MRVWVTIHLSARLIQVSRVSDARQDRLTNAKATIPLSRGGTPDLPTPPLHKFANRLPRIRHWWA